MHLHTSTLTSLLILSTNALPQKPQDLLDPSPRLPDNCGPTKQNPPLSPSNTCNSAPLVVPQPSAFGIYGVRPPDNFPSSHTTNWLSCTATATQICATMSMPNTLAGRWYFNSSILPSQIRPSDSRSACKIGVWLPRDDIGPVKSESSDPNAARKPSLEQCQRTLNATIDAAKYSQPLWVNASINLVKEPEGVEGQWKIVQGNEKEVSTGIAFNSGYPSYILTVHPSLIPPGKCLDTDGSTCDCGSDRQTCAPQCRYDNGNLCECGDDGRTCRIEDGGSAGDVSCLSEEEGEEGVLVECPE